MGDSVIDGIAPTCVGKTIQFIKQTHRLQVHPQIGGEDVDSQARAKKYLRFTPICVGKTSSTIFWI